MRILDRRTSKDLVKLAIFIVVTTMATALLVVTIGNISFGRKTTYSAEFTDATGVVKGDDIRIAGVKVGSVTDVKVHDGDHAMVTFQVLADQPLAHSTHATIRFRNLVGQRYIALTDSIGDSSPMASGDTIPVNQTAPSLDLTVLFNGFKPLFQALSPAEVNQLSYEIIQVFQGEGGTVESLLDHTASVTNTLADRDEVIDSLITNLNTVLDKVADRDKQLTRLIISYRDLVHGLAKDKDAIVGSLDQISSLSTETAGLIDDIRSPLVADLTQLRRLTKNLSDDRGEIDRALQVLPIKLNKIGRAATYGSWFNFYLCNFHGTVLLPGKQSVPVAYNTGGERCNLG